ncbi:MAG: M42 family metallopeptidase [Enterococcus sp.]
MYTKDLLIELSNINGISGRETDVQKSILKHTDRKTTVDAMGNVFIGNRKSQKTKVALWAHMDEVGFYVRRITDDGFILFEQLGNWWGHAVLGQQMQLTIRKTGQVIQGVVGTLPAKAHPLQKVVPIEEMYLDVGAITGEELIQLGVQPGDMLTPATSANLTFNEKNLIGKALDNRVACTVILQTLKRFSEEKIDLIGVATVQEEVGTRGSQVAAKTIDADYNFVIDVANGKDTPKAAEYPFRILGNGPGLVLSDKTALATIELLDFVQETAERNKINYQYDSFSGGGTDAGSVLLSNGKPTMVISVPVRYCHSWNSMVALSDIEATIELLCAVVERIEAGEL